MKEVVGRTPWSAPDALVRPSPMNTIAIVGVGLIGSSFGLALRKAGFAGPILGVSSPPAIAAGLVAGAISARATLEEAAAQADLLYLAQPVDRILVTLERLGPIIRPECLVTDAGSTKTAIVQKARKCLPAENFLGGHPLAGKEQRGAHAADPDLFRNRPYVLASPVPGTPAAAEFQIWLHRIGAQVLYLSAAEHDRTVAFTSHLPQILSTALALTLAKNSSSRSTQIFGPGLLDMTRLALSAPDLWMSILSTNQVEVSSAIDFFTKSLADLKAALSTPDLSLLFEAAAKFASEIRR
jgi:prephenate dehydrogenase